MRRPSACRLRLAAGPMAGVVLAACVIPLPIQEGYRHGSRENLGPAAQQSIVAGKTTREDVLLSLGPPDSAALDESWLLYACARSQGGMLLFIYPSPAVPAFQTVEYTRLVVYFDDTGVVERTRFEQQVCRETEIVAQGGDIKPRPCLDVLGRDLPLMRQRRAPD